MSLAFHRETQWCCKFQICSEFSANLQHKVRCALGPLRTKLVAYRGSVHGPGGKAGAGFADIPPPGLRTGSVVTHTRNLLTLKQINCNVVWNFARKILLKYCLKNVAAKLLPKCCPKTVAEKCCLQISKVFGFCGFFSRDIKKYGTRKKSFTIVIPSIISWVPQNILRYTRNILEYHRESLGTLIIAKLTLPFWTT